ncbi:cytosine deaminase [Rhizobiales bacterium GAS191]|nr:cytosine deaminase [Rhizobiales bacterium GAS191]
MNKVAHIPSSLARYRLVDARLPVCLTEAEGLVPDQDGLAPATLLIEAGRVAEITAGNHSPSDTTPLVHLDGGIVLPTFTDIHTHLDKGHIWQRQRNLDGSFASALLACKADRARWSADDVRARMRFGLASAYAHGTSAIRTHIDSMIPQIRISWPVFAELKEEWHGRIELQGSTLFAVDLALDDAHFADISWAMREHGAMLGAVTYMGPQLEAGLERLFRLAAEKGSDLDFHVDETHDPAARSLEVIADMAIAHRFAGKILCGHCCSLAVQPEDDAKRIIDKVAKAGIAIVSLPMCNLYLQDRDMAARRTPRWRGVTALHELKAAGVEVMIASDNTRDPFYAYGDLDMLEVFREGTRILHLDHPVGDWLKAVSSTPASVMGAALEGGLREGAVADLVLFRARSFTELLARPQADRTVLRSGAAIAAAPPDHRELDALSLLPPEEAGEGARTQ